MSQKKGSCLCCSLGILTVVVLLGFVIIMPNSVQYVEFYEYALLKQRSTGLVSRDKIFANTRIFRGPDYTMQTYKSTSHHVRLDRLAVATIDRVGIEVSVSFQYFIRKEDLVLLNDEYGEDYEEVIIERATDALKGKAPSFTARQYIDNRTQIELAFFHAIRRRVEGVCCHDTCKAKGTCIPDCKPSGCSIAELGVLVEVGYFQLLDIFINQEIDERYRRALILEELAEKAELEQQAAVIRKETESLVEMIRQQTNTVNQVAAVERNKILMIGAANKTAILDAAHQNGLLHVYDRLNISQEEHRNTFDYLRVLRGDKSVHLTVDFQQRTIGTWTKN